MASLLTIRDKRVIGGLLSGHNHGCLIAYGKAMDFVHTSRMMGVCLAIASNSALGGRDVSFLKDTKRLGAAVQFTEMRKRP
jgi:hypothetical protein